jgi:hypothetical protein
MKPIALIIGGVILAVPLVWLIRNSRLNTASAPYTVVRTDGEFEFRDYPELTLATAAMEGSQDSASFMQLFQFITGKNATEEKIPMTTPVLIDPATGKRTMSFVMPAVRKSVPEPKVGKVRLTKMERGHYIALRFAGRATEENQRAAIEKLQAWLREHKIGAEGEPIVAYYDPPWTPIFLRRNEVLVRVRD